jgi:hypothetical protein
LTVTGASIASVNAGVAVLSGNLTLNGGTANGVLYLNGSKVATSGSALTFDGTSFVAGVSAGAGQHIFRTYTSGGFAAIYNGAVTPGSTNYSFVTNATQTTLNAATFISGEVGGTEGFRLTSTSLYTASGINVGIGTSSPETKLHVEGSSGSGVIQIGRDTGAAQYQYVNFGGNTTGDDAWQIGRSSNSGGLGGDGAFYLFDLKNNATRLSVTTSGNLGLGVTPSAWSGFSAFQASRGSFAATTAEVDISHNAFYDGAWKYIANGFATNHYQANGEYIWRTAPSGTAGNPISFTQAMTLDASGRLLIGLTSGTEALSISSSDIYQISFKNSSGSAAAFGADSSSNLRMYANGSERARITSGGDLLVGRTTASAVAPRLDVQAANFAMAINTTNGGSDEAVRFYNNGSVAGSITTTSTTTAYNVSSDQRLKKNIQDAPAASDLIDAIQVRSFDWKFDDSHQRYGMVAQELLAVAPEAVHKPTDPDDMMAVDYSKLVPMLVKEIQSLRARVAALESK